jgi:hypothetical protein
MREVPEEPRREVLQLDKGQGVLDMPKGWRKPRQTRSQGHEHLRARPRGV